jgi:hypothetical protein
MVGSNNWHIFVWELIDCHKADSWSARLTNGQYKTGSQKGMRRRRPNYSTRTLEDRLREERVHLSSFFSWPSISIVDQGAEVEDTVKASSNQSTDSRKVSSINLNNKQNVQQQQQQQQQNAYGIHFHSHGKPRLQQWQCH